MAFFNSAVGVLQTLVIALGAGLGMADTKRKLDNDIFATAGFAQKNNCALTRLDYLQEAGFMSSIPLGEWKYATGRKNAPTHGQTRTATSIRTPIRYKCLMSITS